MGSLARMLRSPLGWFVFVLAEWLLVIAAVAVIGPGMPVAAGAVALVAVVVALTWGNVRLGRWVGRSAR